MDRRTLIDEMHAMAEGSLPPEDEARLRSQCEADPDLKQLLEQVLEVHLLTEVADAEPPACLLTFEDLSGAFVTPRTWRTVLRPVARAAAAVLVLAVGVYFLADVLTGRPVRPIGGEAGRTLVLSAIPLDRAEEPGAGVATDVVSEVSAVLADYRPVKDEEILWIDSFETAAAMARFSSRPVLLFLHHPTCPACRQMRDNTFTHEEVLSRIDRFIPAMISVLDLDPSLRPLLKEGWPWFGVVDAQAKTILSFPGLHGPGEFSAQLTEAETLTPRVVFEWDDIHRLAGRARDAQEAEQENRYGTAFREWNLLAADPDGGPFSRIGEAGARRIGIRARDALLGARELARTENGATAAVDVLLNAAERFSGTPYASDLSLVRDRLIRDGRFPQITSPKR